MPRHLRTVGLATLLLFFVSACAGPRETAEPVEEGDALPTPAVDLSAYEDFDPSVFEELALSPAAQFEHDVPDRLMEGRADAGVRSEVQGFRIQVHSSLDKNAAVDVEEQVQEWLRAESNSAPTSLTSGEPPIYVVYIQPYYRVRIGNFTSRQAAERAREHLALRFPGAFIVPDTVVITR